MSRRKEKQYSEDDLLGLTVGHSEDVFKEGERVILTLKDRDVLEEGDDILENVNLVDQEKANKNVANKTGKTGVYRPYDNEEFDEFGIAQRKTLLSKYDEEIEGSKRDTFKIGLTAAEKQLKLDEIKEQLRKEKGTVSLEVQKYKMASEYYTEEEMSTFKKPKKIKGLRKEKKGKRKQVTADDLMPLSNEDSDANLGSRFKKRSKKGEGSIQIKQEEGETEIDEAEEEHQFLINQALQKKKIVSKNLNSSNKRHKKNNDEFELVKVKEEQKSEDEEEEEDLAIPDEEIYGMVLEEDDLQVELQKAVEKARKIKQKELDEEKVLAQVVNTIKSLEPVDQEMQNESNGLVFEPNNDDIILNSTAEFCKTLGDIHTLKEEKEEEDLLDFENDLLEEKRAKEKMEVEEDERNKWSEVNIHQEQPKLAELIEGQPILEEEPDVSVGVVGALKLAMKKGYLDKDVKKANKSAHISSIQAKNYTIEEKFYDDDKHGRRERYSGMTSEFKEKSGYKPDVKLEYVDDNGRLMNEKEAFRVLSHKFHGKGPGKNKIDKRMKKLEQESKLLSMTSTDTPLGTLKLLQEKQKELHSAHVVLSSNQNTLSKKLK